MLQPAQLEVVPGHFRHEAHTHVVQRRLEALRVGRGRMDLRADAAEKIELPERVEAGAIDRDDARLFGEAREGLPPAIDAGADAHFGKPIAIDFVEERARLIDARHGHADVMVVLQGPRHQSVEHRILELSPPARIEGLLGDERRIGIREPCRLDHRRHVRPTHRTCRRGDHQE